MLGFDRRVVVLGTIVGAAFAASHTVSPEYAYGERDLLSVPIADCNGCYECENWECIEGHKVVADSEGTVTGPAHGCWCLGDNPKDCEEHGHEDNPECDGTTGPGGGQLAVTTFGALGDLLVALRSGDPRLLASSLDEYGEAIELNVARRALQAIGCGGRLVAHLPLSESQYHYLTSRGSP